MADAFVAVADDATASSWNPAGLVQLERPEFSFVGSFNGIRERLHARSDHPEFPTNAHDENFDVNFMSFAYPLPFLLGGHNATISLSYQQKFDLSRSLDFDFLSSTTIGRGNVLSNLQTVDFEQDGGLATITPAFAIEITRRLSIGVAVNFWRDTPVADTGWEQTTHLVSELRLNNGPASIVETTRVEEFKHFEGENFVLGLLWNFRENWNLGLRYDTRLKADVDYKMTEMGTQVVTNTTSENRKISFPDTWAIGLSYRVNDRLTIAADLSITNWDDFYMETEDGTKFSLVDASNLDDPALASNFDATKTIRVGAEYVFIPKEPDADMPRLWTIRGGVFYDEEPASGRSTTDLTDPGDGQPDRFFGFTAGLGLLAFQRFNFDIAYQLRYGHDVNSDFVRGVPGFDEDVIQHRILLSTVIYF